MISRQDSQFLYVWSGTNFPFINLLSVVSVIRHHPECSINIVVVGEEPQSEWFAVLKNFRNVAVEFAEPGDVFAGLPPELKGVADSYQLLSARALSAKSNLLRYALLYQRGGIYLDFDVLVLRAMDELFQYESFVGRELVWASDVARHTRSWLIHLTPANMAWALSHAGMWIDSHVFAGALQLAQRLGPTFRYWSSFQANNAILGCSSGAEFLFDVLRGVSGSNLKVRYSTGPTLIEEICRSTRASVKVLSTSAFYYVPPGQTYRLFYDKKCSIPDEAFCIHFAASNHKNFVDSFVPDAVGGLSRETVMGALLPELMSFLNKHRLTHDELSQR